MTYWYHVRIIKYHLDPLLSRAKLNFIYWEIFFLKLKSKDLTFKCEKLAHQNYEVILTLYIIL